MGFYPDDAARERHGILREASIPTGLVLIDMRCFDILEQPYFDYVYADDSKSKRTASEDTYFSRQMQLTGLACYVNWNAWVAHRKPCDVPGL